MLMNPDHKDEVFHANGSQHIFGAPIKIFTIGFRGKTAEQFFGLLSTSGVKRVIDVRLNNTSQLAGFTKKRDLEYFLRRICGIEYLHIKELAPSAGLLASYRKKTISWDQYEREFKSLLERRRVEQHFDPALLADSCLLCAEETPEKCHRRLVAEYFESHWRQRLGPIKIIHL